MQILVRDVEDFAKLSKFATYASALTGVLDVQCENMDDEHKKIVLKYCSHIVIDEPTAKKQGDKIIVSTDNSEIRDFLQLRPDGEVTIYNYESLIQLLDQGVIKDELFTEELSSNTADLACDSFTAKYKGSITRISDCVEKIDDLPFDTESTTTLYAHKNFIVENVVKENGVTKLTCSNGESKVEIWKHAFCSYSKGDMISFLTSGRTLGYYIFDPDFCLSQTPDEVVLNSVTTRRRIVPVQLLKLAYAEIQYRRNKK